MDESKQTAPEMGFAIMWILMKWNEQIWSLIGVAEPFVE